MSSIKKIREMNTEELMREQVFLLNQIKDNVKFFAWVLFVLLFAVIAYLGFTFLT